MTHDEKLRQAQLVFYAEDVSEIEQELDGFLELSGARCAMLIDRGGHLVTRRGESVGESPESVAALAAGSFAATREMARLMGEDDFNTLFHQGTRESIQLSQIGDRALFAIVFDDRSNLGLVRFYAEESQGRLRELFQEMTRRQAERVDEDPARGLAADFSSSAAAALDELF
ncbi:MAG: roadblock/LC7 domain-containing protein [Planctomycetes bacterium]|nr:roadblock/LC7 domain-containing protein [Planctomycetota bacterium]